MESFMRGWLERQEQFRSELLTAPRDSSSLLRGLVGRVLAHYHEYYQEKSRAASRDVFSVLFPSWLTPYERTFLWISGWKPSLVFRLLDAGAVAPLSPEQELAISELRRETALAERELSEEMARAQEAFAMPQVLGFVRGARRGLAMAEPVGELVGDFEQLVVAADVLRTRIVDHLAGILEPAQWLISWPPLLSCISAYVGGGAAATAGPLDPTGGGAKFLAGIPYATCFSIIIIITWFALI